MERTRQSVLVVEDDAHFREALAVLLQINRYDVVEAADGEEALRLLRSQSGVGVGLIVLDLRMPRMDGRAFRAEQLGDPTLAPIPVVIVCGEGDGVVVAARLEPVAYYQKPLSVEDLEDLLALAARYCGATLALREQLATPAV